MKLSRWHTHTHTHTRGSDARFILYGCALPSSEASGDHILTSDLQREQRTRKPWRNTAGNSDRTKKSKTNSLQTQHAGCCLFLGEILYMLVSLNLTDIGFLNCLTPPCLHSPSSCASTCLSSQFQHLLCMKSSFTRKLYCNALTWLRPINRWKFTHCLNLSCSKNDRLVLEKPQTQRHSLNTWLSHITHCFFGLRQSRSDWRMFPQLTCQWKAPSRLCTP